MTARRPAIGDTVAFHASQGVRAGSGLVVRLDDKTVALRIHPGFHLTLPLSQLDLPPDAPASDPPRRTVTPRGPAQPRLI